MTSGDGRASGGLRVCGLAADGLQRVRYIVGAQKVLDVLGTWSFHDAEVISFSAERALPPGREPTHARLAVLVRQYAAAAHAVTVYEPPALQRSVLVRFLFRGVCDLRIDDFNHQNVIDAITVSPADPPAVSLLQVDIASVWGFGGTLRCACAEVEAVEAVEAAGA